MKFTKTGNYLEIRVGADQCVEVLLYLRRRDLDWFSDDESNTALAKGDDESSSLFEEFLELLQDDILPRMFQEEMEESFYAANKHIKPPPKNLGPGGVAIAELNSTVDAGRKRKRISKKTVRLQRQLQIESQRTVKTKDVYYSFGKRMKLMYRLQPQTTQHETLVFRKESGKKDDINGELSTQNMRGDCQRLKRLSKRLLVWVFPTTDEAAAMGRDESNTMEGGGFPRPEMIPLADLFRTNETTDDSWEYRSKQFM